MTHLTSTQFSVLPADAVSLPEFGETPFELAKSWPKKEPLIALIAGNGESRWSRWSIIAPATGRRMTLRSKHDLAEFQTELDAIKHTSLVPGWIGYLGYELGECFEPEVRVTKPKQREWPLADFIWCDQCLVHDAEDNSWWSVGGFKPPVLRDEHQELKFGQLVDVDGDAKFGDAVDSTKLYIHEGDIFQANITRRFSSNVSGDIRSASLDTLADPGGWFGAWIEFADDDCRSLLSLSPELFLQFDGVTRTVISRPMKGTRPITDPPETLMNSDKDAAELHMIVDLMRNDLGRVCEFGSMQVTESRAIEQHPTVWQCTAEVQGTLRSDSSAYDLIKSTFPAGSITGAPKIRAMQIIDELETTARGAYCGSIGIIGGSMLLNVAIRTAAFRGTGSTSNFQGSLTYGTGCGIVADSVVSEECEESHVKTNVLRSSPFVQH
jgi:anthranilate/para-aminobenzoate synthase component I|tara:strand:+ start:539 stop:1852 length:1314 start_codon:yes stop_codon:yes gene_type:complete